MLPGPKKKEKKLMQGATTVIYSVKLFVQNYNKETLEVDDY